MQTFGVWKVQCTVKHADCRNIDQKKITDTLMEILIYTFNYWLLFKRDFLQEEASTLRRKSADFELYKNLRTVVT